jgi:outer membrane protein assembly factor BamB
MTKTQMALLTCLVSVTADLAAGAFQGTSWPHFGGPGGDFRAPDAPLALEWKDGPPVRWSRELGEGFSGIAASGDALYTMYRRGEDEVVVSLEASTGRTRWEHAMPAPAHPKQDFSQGPGPHATPLITEDLVCAAGSTARLRCLDAATGRLIWSRDLVAEDGATVVYRGYSSSPIAHGDAVIVQGGGSGRAVMAFDRRTGKPRWRGGDYANTNSTPALLKFEGDRQLVAFMADVVAGFHPDTGEELWSHPHPQRFTDNISRPIRAGDLLIVTSALDGGTRALRVTRDGSRWAVQERWHQPRAGAYYTNAVAAGGLVLLSSGGIGPTFFSALRPDTGDIAWQTRDVLRAQLVAVGDNGVLVLRDEEGGLALATVGAEGVRVRSRVEMFAGGAPSPPTLVGGTLYARDRERIVSIDLSRPGAASAGRVMAAGLRP